MTRPERVSRDAMMIRALTESLRPLPHVHAFWEADAAARKSEDPIETVQRLLEEVKRRLEEDAKTGGARAP